LSTQSILLSNWKTWEKTNTKTAIEEVKRKNPFLKETILITKVKMDMDTAILNKIIENNNI
jgi:hypothetical protein